MLREGVYRSFACRSTVRPHNPEVLRAMSPAGTYHRTNRHYTSAPFLEQPRDSGDWRATTEERRGYQSVDSYLLRPSIEAAPTHDSAASAPPGTDGVEVHLLVHPLGRPIDVVAVPSCRTGHQRQKYSTLTARICIAPWSNFLGSAWWAALSGRTP